MGSLGGGSTNSPCITVTKNRERHGSYWWWPKLLQISWKSWEIDWFPISHIFQSHKQTDFKRVNKESYYSPKRCTLHAERPGAKISLVRLWASDQTVKHCFSNSGGKLKWSAEKQTIRFQIFSFTANFSWLCTAAEQEKREGRGKGRVNRPANHRAEPSWHMSLN